MFSAALWVNLATFLGVLILAVPVWSMDQRKGRLAKEKAAALETDPDGFEGELVPHLITLLKKDIDDWRPLDRACLIVGYVLLLGSAFARLILPACPQPV